MFDSSTFSSNLSVFLVIISRYDLSVLFIYNFSIPLTDMINIIIAKISVYIFIVNYVNIVVLILFQKVICVYRQMNFFSV